MDTAVVPHAWFDCRPALLKVEDVAGSTGALGLEALGRVWADMTDSERHRFHSFTCENDRSMQTMETISRMRDALLERGFQ